MKLEIQKIFRYVGLRIGFDHPIRHAPKLFAVKASELHIETVLDIGANGGQFVRELRGEGYQGKVVSFEPLSAAYTILESAASRDPLWMVAPRMALGETSGNYEINISRNLASSSFLKVSRQSVEASDGSEFVESEIVPVRRLDDIVAQSWMAPFAVKLDTQGFELRVLNGGERLLREHLCL